MNSNDAARSSGEQHYQVKNVGAIFGALLLTFIFGIVSLFFLIKAPGALIIFLPLTILPFLRYKVIKDGISFDLENGIMSYPGGGVSANSLSDWFSANYIFQYFRRFTIELSEIRSICNSWTRKENVYTYYIEVNGKFGTSKITFGTNESKRDEAYSFIRQHNRMGEPIIFN